MFFDYDSREINFLEKSLFLAGIFFLSALFIEKLLNSSFMKSKWEPAVKTIIESTLEKIGVGKLADYDFGAFRIFFSFNGCGNSCGTSYRINCGNGCRGIKSC